MLIANSRSTNPISSILLLVVFWLVNFSLSLREVLLYQSSWSNFIFLKMVSAHLSIIGISILLNKVLQKNKIVGVVAEITAYKPSANVTIRTRQNIVQKNLPKNVKATPDRKSVV